MNRTIITSNQRKPDMEPSKFLGKLLNDHGKEKLLDILKTHLIPEDALDALLNDDLSTFKEKEEAR